MYAYVYTEIYAYVCPFKSIQVFESGEIAWM